MLINEKITGDGLLLSNLYTSNINTNPPPPQTNSLRMLSIKSTISQTLKIAKIGKLIFHSFQNIAQHFGPKYEKILKWLFLRGGDRADIFYCQKYLLCKNIIPISKNLPNSEMCVKVTNNI